MGTGKTFINLHHRGVPLWAPVMLSNLSAVFRLARIAVAAMMKKRFGRLIGVSSVVARMGNAGQANYCASKAGMEGFFSRRGKRSGGTRRYRQYGGAGFYRYGYDKKLTGYVERIFNRSNARKAYGRRRRSGGRRVIFGILFRFLYYGTHASCQRWHDDVVNGTGSLIKS